MPIMSMFTAKKKVSWAIPATIPVFYGLWKGLLGFRIIYLKPPKFCFDSELDPGGNLVNRPSNSLAEIYKSWHFQTLAPFEQRMEILKISVSQHKVEGWKLLRRLMPEHHGTASPTFKMRWRLFDKTSILYINILKFMQPTLR